MTLMIEVHIDDEQLGVIDIFRVTGAPGGNHVDSINSYRWQYVCDGQMADGQVTHRYGDGALALITKVLLQITGDHRPHVTPRPDTAQPSSRVPQRKQPKWSGV
ncbi:hypothetical protein BCA37_10685 [Mycobacterium sp. djl-10]|nr:hypothetical protein BCA37_10685 [Mycobacterium sp. djl-10]